MLLNEVQVKQESESVTGAGTCTDEHRLLYLETKPNETYN